VSLFYKYHLGGHNLVAVYLMSCYLYEHEADSVLDDREFDKLCTRIYLDWEEISHPHKWLIDRESLTTSTASYLRREDFPAIITGAAHAWLKEFNNPPTSASLRDQHHPFKKKG
jgi:hypothetical protein